MNHSALPAADAAFATAMTEKARGPERDGVFALWLVVRAALGMAGVAEAGVRHAARLAGVAARLRSLNTPAPLRRSLSAALADLQPPRSTGPGIVLQQLVAPAGETLGRKVAEAVAAASRAARGVQV
jgi:hypothetical protein